VPTPFDWRASPGVATKPTPSFTRAPAPLTGEAACGVGVCVLLWHEASYVPAGTAASSMVAASGKVRRLMCRGTSVEGDLGCPSRPRRMYPLCTRRIPVFPRRHFLPLRTSTSRLRVARVASSDSVGFRTPGPRFASRGLTLNCLAFHRAGFVRGRWKPGDGVSRPHLTPRREMAFSSAPNSDALCRPVGRVGFSTPSAIEARARRRRGREPPGQIRSRHEPVKA
jgi:hypothetical protein